MRTAGRSDWRAHGILPAPSSTLPKRVRPSEKARREDRAHRAARRPNRMHRRRPAESASRRFSGPGSRRTSSRSGVCRPFPVAARPRSRHGMSGNWLTGPPIDAMRGGAVGWERLPETGATQANRILTPLPDAAGPTLLRQVRLASSRTSRAEKRVAFLSNRTTR